MENNLESYLSTVEAELKDVPAVRTSEFMDEVRAHLYAMCEAKRTDGASSHAAWLAAMTEFGEPDKVGRDLRAQWASSGQLETEGASLSKQRKVRMFARPVVACTVCYLLFTLMRAPEHKASWQLPVIAVIVLGCLAYGIVSTVRYRGGWTASTIVGCISAVIIASNALFNLSGHRAWGGEWREKGFPIFILFYVTLYYWLRRRERTDRPWQWSALYKTSPIAAEQEYRLYPLVGLAMGTTMGCIGIILVGLQFFGLPIALLSCAGLIGVSTIFGRWLLM